MNSSLNGLRAIAILAVMLYHCGAPLAYAGWLGVDLFFVLSGFLITTLLLKENQKFGRIDLRRFWARRFLRLMPVYVLYVSGVTIAMLVGPSTNLTAHGGWTPGMYITSLWTYLANLPPSGGIWTEQHLTRHLWSLSVEEQFYFIWPVALIFIFNFLRQLTAVSWIIVAIVWLCNLMAYGDSPPAGLLYTRGIGLAIGCSFAITLYRHELTLIRLNAISSNTTALASGLVIFIYVGISYAAEVLGMREPELLRFGIPLFDLAVGLLIVNLWHLPNSRTSNWLSFWPLPQIGIISYGAYVYHMLAWDVTWHYLLANIDHWPRYPKFGLRLTVFIVLTLIISTLSYKLIERPFLRIKERFRH